MANIYVSCRGSGGAVKRLGGSFGTAYAATWKGGIRVAIRRGDDGVERFTVTHERHNGAGIEGLIAEGIVGQASRRSTKRRPR